MTETFRLDLRVDGIHTSRVKSVKKQVQLSVCAGYIPHANENAGEAVVGEL
jgi:hypothetical protein